MSIKGTRNELFVGREECNLLDKRKNKTKIVYSDLIRIEYMLAESETNGVIDFIKPNKKTRFEFNSLSNDPVRRTIDFIREYCPELEIIESVLCVEEPKTKKETKPCKYCRTEIDRKASICPNCRKKQGSIVPVIFALLLAIIIYSTYSGKQESSNTASSDNSISVKQKDIQNPTETEIIEEATNIFEEGDTFESDQLKILFLDCGDFETDNEFLQPESGNKYVFVEFSVENVGDTDYSVGSFDFDCYADDTECKYAITGVDGEMTSVTTLSPGRNTKGKICYEVPIEAVSIEVEFETSFWTQDKIYFVVK